MKRIIELFENFRYKYDISSVFYDFLVMASAALSNQVDFMHFDEREVVFKKVKSKYTEDEFKIFAEILAELTITLSNKKSDVLGEVYMKMNLGKKCGGQFFTPYHVSQAMARLTVQKDKLAYSIEQKGYVSVNEPCTGGGGMCIAFAEEFEKAGFDIGTQLYIVAQDIDMTCVMMTYIQLSLLNVPAQVLHCNSLSLEVYDIWYTPAFMLNEWPVKLYCKNEESDDLENAC